MIFKLWKQVLDGTKTQTRRPLSPQHVGMTVDDVTVPFSSLEAGCYVDKVVEEDYGREHRDFTRWEIGRIYPVMSKSHEPVIGHIRLMSIRLERLNDISEEDAKAEGVYPIKWDGYGPHDEHIQYESYRWAFQQFWNDCYKAPRFHWESNPLVWVLKFELVSNT